MVQTRPEKDSSFYGAQISGWLSESACFNLTWYSGNIYEDSENPVSSSLSMSLGQVQKVYEDNYLGLPKVSFCSCYASYYH